MAQHFTLAWQQDGDLTKRDVIIPPRWHRGLGTRHLAFRRLWVGEFLIQTLVPNASLLEIVP